MPRLIRFQLVAFIVVVLQSLSVTADEPNVVFILADDLGWSDTTLFGTTKYYKTPNIQRLAARGMTFTHAYSASPLCSPTRASILTGLSPARHGITVPQCHGPQVILEAIEGTKAPPHKKSIGPISASRLDTKYDGLAKTLQDAGYATGHFGKWHLGPEPYSPLQHGFDVDVPHWHGPGPAGSYVAPWKFLDFDHDPDIPNEHIEDRMAKEAVAFIKQHKDEPFFLNYWMFSVHAPFDAKKELIEKYRKTVDLSDPQRCPIYAAMIESMDDAVGTLLDALDRLGVSDNTIIVLASDNGGNMYNEVEGERPTSNAPLRGGKATMYEGGVRGPCTIVWPDKVAAGSRSDEVVQSMDFYPTLLEMIKLQPKPGQSFDGVSLLPTLAGSRLQREAIFTYFPHDPPVPDWMPPSISVHRGDWKLIRIFHGGEDSAHRWKLFNLKDDIGERNDLAGTHPEIVKQLDALIESHLIETDAKRPIPNPDFHPGKYDPTLEGVQPKKTAGNPNRKTNAKSKRGGPPVAGWRPDNNCELSIADGKLRIKCIGGDPHLSFSFAKPLPKGKLTLKVTLASTVGGNAQLFWHEVGVKPPFFRDRSITFQVESDGQPHDYALAFEPKNDLAGIRLDPATIAGDVKINAISLHSSDEMLHTWSFTEASSPVSPTPN